MQESNFEKRVQQKMGDLSFEPTEPVWLKVEAAIKRKKQRRRLVFFLLPLLLLTGGAIWYAISTTDKAVSPTTAVSQKWNNTANNDTSLKAIQQKENTQKEPETFPTQANDAVHTTAPQKDFETFIKSKNVKKEKQPAMVAEGRNEETETGLPQLLADDMHAMILQNEIDKKEGVKKEENISNPFQREIFGKKKRTSALKEKQLMDAIVKDNLADDKKENVTVLPEEKNRDTTVAMPEAVVQVKPGKKSNLEWTVNARIGIAGLRTGVGSMFGQESAADFYASPQTGNNAPPAFSNASTLNNGVAFTIGAGVRKKMFQNLFVNAGLQYSQYATRSNVGTQVAADTAFSYSGRTESVNSYYRAGGSGKAYTTRYHYIELPVSFEYRLFKKLPLHLHHGFSIGRLIKTNALYFDAPSQLLYKSDAWLRNTGFNFFTTIDYQLLQGKAFSVFVGPQLQWGLTPVQQKVEAKKHHLFFAGLQTRVTF